MNSTRVQFRVSAADRRAIALRVPPGLELSAWLRQLALGESPQRTRASATPRRTGAMTTMSAAERACANAQASVAIQLNALLQRSAASGTRLSPELETELRELAGHVRARLLV